MAYSGERACQNCIRYEECYSIGLVDNNQPGFRLRSDGWDRTRYEGYLKDIRGQLCGNFEMQPAQRSARRAGVFGIDVNDFAGFIQREEQPKRDTEWDEESN